ncbi:MAG: VWA domain-containing protein [Actinobacteria bacterium]|nr:VWA domain-containing protein [Actinomycetota bacterium]
MTRRLRLLAGLVAALLSVPAAAAAQIVPPLPPPPWPCPDCRPPNPEVVIADYRVEALIDAQVATTTVTQVLANRGFRDAEAVFLFPLPAGAVATGLALWIDGEPVRGEVLAADQARGKYEEIVRFLRDPALLEFADQGLVRLSVFPIPAGGERTVRLEYTEVLAADQGLVRYRHPLGRETAGLAEIRHLTARIEIRSQEEIKAVYSPTHRVSVDRPTPTSARVGFESTGADPAGDFALYYSTAEGLIGLNLLSFREPGEDGFFLLLASPGLAADPSRVVAKDVTLVLDRSGSMEGEKFAQAVAAARFVLDHLNEGDRFNLIVFSTGVEAYAERPRLWSEAPAAKQWLDRFAAEGSTDIDRALRTAFERADAERPTYVLFLTDGLPTEGIIDTTEILRRAQETAPDTVSLFAFGVGWDVDTLLLDSLAENHHGTTTYVVPGESVDEAVTGLYAKVSAPMLTALSIDLGEAGAYDLYPMPLPDLFSGEQLVLAGRFRHPGSHTVTLAGEVAGETRRFAYEGIRFTESGGPDSLPRLWATRKIGHLLKEVRLRGPNDELIDQIVRLSIRYGVVTPYTSYLVTEDTPFGEDRLREISEAAAEYAATTVVPSSGKDAVGQASTAGGLAGTDLAGAPAAEYQGLVRTVGSRAFRLAGEVWTDTAFDPESGTVRVPFLSDDYFALAAVHPDLAAALALAERVIVVWEGTTYEVVAAGDAGDSFTMPPTTTTAAVAVTGAGTTGTTAAAFVPEAGDGDGLPAGAIAGIAGAIALVAFGGVALALRRRRAAAD